MSEPIATDAPNAMRRSIAEEGPTATQTSHAADTTHAQARLIHHGKIIVDKSRVFQSTDDNQEAPGNPPFPPDEPDWIVPLQTWLSRDAPAYAKRQNQVAILLSPDSELTDLFADCDADKLQTLVSFIAIDFPVYTDGRGYSLAQLLRQQYGWQGELRATGDVMIDTMHYLARCGFDSFLVKPSHDPGKALAALGAFSVHYQKSYPAVAPVQTVEP